MSVVLPIFTRRVLGVAATLTTPLLPDDYLGYLNPLWSRREPRGVVDCVLPETPDAATVWLRTPAGWVDVEAASSAPGERRLKAVAA